MENAEKERLKKAKRDYKKDPNKDRIQLLKEIESYNIPNWGGITIKKLKSNEL